jgi:hypothetical protein
MHRTKAGLLLEKILNGNKHRYLLCWNGEREDSEESPYDCACCITWSDNELYQRCGCICHERIEEMARVPHIKLWLLALESMDELPKFFTSYAEKLTYCKPIAAQHEEHRQGRITKYDFGPCKCEFCEFVRDDVHRKFAIEGEDNSHINDKPVPTPCVIKGSDGTIYRIHEATRIEVEPPPTVADTSFESWWSSTNNQNWFSNKPVTLKDLKETAHYAWKAAGGAKTVSAEESYIRQLHEDAMAPGVADGPS